MDADEPKARGAAGPEGAKGNRIAVLIFLLLTVVFIAVVTYGITNIRIHPVPGEPPPGRDAEAR